LEKRKRKSLKRKEHKSSKSKKLLDSIETDLKKVGSKIASITNKHDPSNSDAETPSGTFFQNVANYTHVTYHTYNLYAPYKIVSTVNDAHTENLAMILKNDQAKEIIISFRGTVPSDVNNLLEDADIKWTKVSSLCTKCKVSSGFYKAYMSLRDQIFDDFKSLYSQSKYHDYNIKITGHSLGGAMATIFAMYMVNQKYTFTLITFGCPRVGNREFAQAVDHDIPHNYRNVFQWDVVPQVPTNVVGYYHSGQLIWWKDTMTFENYGGIEQAPDVHKKSLADHHGYWYLMNPSGSPKKKMRRHHKI